MRDFLREMRQALRLLHRRPGYAAVVVATIALGLGSTTAVFSLADWMLIRPLPGVRDDGRLHVVELRSPEDRTAGLSLLNLEDVATTAQALEHVAGWQFMLLHINDVEHGPIQVFGELIGGDYFGMLGMRPELGRLITKEETRAGTRENVAVLSTEVWRSLFNGDRSVIGRTVTINRQPFTIIGVAANGYRGAERIGRVDVWVPATQAATLRHMPDPAANDTRDASMFSTWGARLAPGITPQAATAEVATIVSRLASAYPDENERLADVRPALLQGVGLPRTARENATKAVRILSFIVALVLIIALANITNMLLVRTVEMRGAMAVRRALGASRGQLLRHQLAEALILAAAGGTAALAVAFVLTRLFSGTRLGQVELEHVPIDARVIAFVLLGALAISLLCALVPAIAARRFDMRAALHAATRRQTGGRSPVRSAIIIMQLSLSLAVLAGALLLTRTLVNLYAIDLGFDTRVVSFTIDMLPQGYDRERRMVFERALLERLQQRPELDDVALTVTTPLAGFYGMARVQHPQNPDTVVSAVGEWVSPGYFETLRTRIVQGRALGQADVGARAGARNIVVSEALARELFAGAPALGRTVRSGGTTPADLTIVGIAENRRVRSLTADPEAVVYEAYDAPSRGAQYVTVIARTSLPLARAEAVLRAVVDEIDPSLPFMYGERLSEKVARSVSEQRLFARMLVALALIAVVMAGVGLYGVVAYSVAARTREIGIRMALGAARGRIARMVVRDGLVVVVPGIVLGLIAARWVAKLVESRLFGVEAADPAVHVAAVVFLVMVAVVAGALPTRTAVRVEPVVALRHE